MAEEKAPEGEGEAKPKSKKKLFIIIGVVVLLIGAGVPAFLLTGKKKDVEHIEEKEKDVKKHYKLATFPTFIVNLSESSSFVKVTMQVEYDPEVLEKATHSASGGEGHSGGGASEGGAEAGGLPPALAEREPMIKDAVIRVLSSKKTAEVLTVDGKDQLKEELIEAINAATGLEEGPVVAVYFTEFIIQ